jgi:DNA primase
VPRFAQTFIDQVVQATDIVDLVGRYVALKKAGREFVGLCPFHEDHRPSMHVVPAKQFFYCFVCGAGGGALKFVELYQKLPFVEAVRALAERANIPIPAGDSEGPAPGLARADLLKVIAAAQDFYRGQLSQPAGKAAREYALKRGLTEESIERFGLGFAPEAWDGLTNALRRKGASEGQLVAAGLVIRRESGPGCYDRFRNRLTFPIMDLEGRVIAFGGRALAADERAKYINSPDSVLFDKSNNLYALNWARPALDAGGTAVVVEGYLDVLLPHQGGVTSVVATMGTALTDRHVRLLSRYAKEVVLVFDSDLAGAKATERALEIFMAQQIHVRVASVPEGKDPCDFVVARGGQAFADLVAAAPDAMQYVWERRMSEYRAAGGNLADRRRLVEDFLRLVATSAAYGAIDEVRRGQLAQHIGHMLNIPSTDLQQQMRALTRTLRPAGPGGNAPAQSASGDTSAAGTPQSRSPAGAGSSLPRASTEKAYTPATGPSPNLVETHVLEVLLNRPDLFDTVVEKLDATDFADPTLAAIARSMWAAGHEGRCGLEELLAREEMSPYGAILARLASEGARRANFEATLSAAMEFLAYRHQRRQLDDLKTGAAGGDEALREFDKALPRKNPRNYPKIT